MNLHYISGFFDADGSISLTRKHSNENKSLQISFHNTQKTLLEQIYKFILDNYNIKGYIYKKVPKKENHSISYDLSYSFRNANKLAALIKSNHPKKVYRINVVLKYYDSVTSKNGKYTKEQLSKKLAFERLFHLVH